MIEIAKTEHSVIRVFAVSRPMSEMARALKQQPKKSLASALLNHPVEDDDFELFALSDLTGVGLPQYLLDGYDVDRAAIRADRAKLEALDGYVLLLFSRVSQEADVVLHPLPELTLIGSYADPKAQHAATPIAAQAAKPYSGTSPSPKVPGRSRVGSALTAVTVLLALLIIWWIL
ncbi:hypothetical protein K3757_03560 [Sulfitobacter sp. S223]|uniref:hypothetical protein n=1 Tax=Sulfitobacter sp. S223 TaxID=2867023 RepID=UPI0021A84316|nr:hypothetical protein [Sulfitobacter sp. S223]UWR27025.1 hypothetical protein K3757_03560 [Sulfitobacter sp. S223]